MIVHFVCIRISVYLCVNTRYSAMLPGYQRCVYDVSTVGNNILPFSLLLSILLSCMALLFTEIVNQLNALSCLHGDDDDDDGDGGFLKRARKAATKPAASSQGLCSPFFHLSPCVPDSLVMSPLQFRSFPQLFGFSLSNYFPASFSSPQSFILWSC